MEQNYPAGFYQDYHKAILFMIISYLSIAIMGVFVKIASVTIPPTEILFFRFFIGLLFTLPLIIKDKDFSFSVSQPGYFALRNIAGLLSMLLMFYSLKYLPVSTSVLLMNTSSFFVPLFVFMLFGEKTALSIILFTVVGFVGVNIVSLSPQEEISVFYILIGLAGAAFAALAYIGINQLSKHHSSLQIVFWFYLMCSLILPLVSGYQWVIPSWHESGLLIMVGLFGLIFQLCITRALKSKNITAVTPFIFTGVIFATVLDWLIWGNTPATQFWLGATVIIVSVSMLALLKNKQVGPPVRPAEGTDSTN